MGTLDTSLTRSLARSHWALGRLAEPYTGDEKAKRAGQVGRGRSLLVMVGLCLSLAVSPPPCSPRRVGSWKRGGVRVRGGGCFRPISFRTQLFAHRETFRTERAWVKNTKATASCQPRQSKGRRDGSERTERLHYVVTALGRYSRARVISVWVGPRAGSRNCAKNSPTLSTSGRENVTLSHAKTDERRWLLLAVVLQRSG